MTLLAPAPGCDCSVCPFFTGNPAAAEPVCSGCNTDCSYCGCARAEAAPPSRSIAAGLVASPCRSCPIRCGSRVDMAAWMADVGGTVAFDDIEVGGPAWPAGLPRFVPQLDGHDVAGLDAQLGWGAYGIGLRRVFSPTSHRLYPRFDGVDAHQALGLGPGQRAVLVGYGEDPLVEAFWSLRRRDRLGPRLAEAGWDVVLAPNFSMYGNQPRAEHLLNFRRNLMVAAELAEVGLCAVANLYWFRLEDLDRYLSWITDTLPAAVAVNLQTFRTAEDWEDMALPGLTYLAACMPAEVRMVVTGSSRADRIATLARLFGTRLTLVSQNPLQYARHGARMTPAGRVDSPARVEDLFAANVRYYAGLVDLAAADAEQVGRAVGEGRL